MRRGGLVKDEDITEGAEGEVEDKAKEPVEDVSIVSTDER